jgi:hypothetical protein
MSLARRGYWQIKDSTPISVPEGRIFWVYRQRDKVSGKRFVSSIIEFRYAQPTQ